MTDSAVFRDSVADTYRDATGPITPGGGFSGDASDVPIIDAANDFTATDVEGALAELQSDAEADASALAAHLADTGDAHDASAISSVAAGNLAATDVQAALNELDSEKAATASAVMDGDAAGGVLAGTYPNPSFAADMATQAELDAHINDTTDAHDASAISSVAAGNLAATDVQAALDELDSEKTPTTRTITAGSGLSGGGTLAADRTFDVNVDASTIEINADTLRVKASGITANEIAPDAVGASELADNAVDTNAIAAGAVTEAKQTLADNTTGNVTSSAHGYTPKSPANAGQFLNGAATPAFAAVKDSDLSTSDITTNDVTSTKHGFAPKAPADATKFLNGAATPAFAAVKDSDLSTSDITTNDVSTSKHGFVPKLPNNTTTFFRADGAYAVPNLANSQAFLATAVSISAATYADLTGCSLSLPAGTWLIIGDMYASAANTAFLAHLAITDGSNVVQAEGSQGMPASGTASVHQWAHIGVSVIVSPGATTTYKLRAARGNTTITGTYTAQDGSGVGVANNASDATDKGTCIRAIRIA